MIRFNILLHGRKLLAEQFQVTHLDERKSSARFYDKIFEYGLKK